MKPEQIKSEIDQLNLTEKLILVEDIWDSIAASNKVLPMPLWQKEVLNERYKAYKKGDEKLHSAEEIEVSVSKIINEA